MLDGEAREAARSIAARYGFAGRRAVSFLNHVEYFLEAEGASARLRGVEPEDPNDSSMVRAMHELISCVFSVQQTH